MVDTRFHHCVGSFRLGDLAKLASADFIGDEEALFTGVAALQDAESDQVSFFHKKTYEQDLAVTRAGCIIVKSEHQHLAPQGCSLIIAKDPYLAYALIAQAFYPQKNDFYGRHPTAFVHQNAKIGQMVRIGAFAVIDDGAVVGDGSVIGAGAYIGPSCIVGQDCVIESKVSLVCTIIGDRVVIYAGACLGQDGFGFAQSPKGFISIPQLGRVIIENDVYIGANTCVDRGAGPDTIIGQGTRIDNLVQIGHNVRIGKYCVIVAQVGIAGSTVIDDFCVIGGQAGIAGHLHIGQGAKIAGQSGVGRDLKAGEEVLGSPAIDKKDFMRQYLALNRLIKSKK